MKFYVRSALLKHSISSLCNYNTYVYLPNGSEDNVFGKLLVGA
jgi:hypothetical protein